MCPVRITGIPFKIPALIEHFRGAALQASRGGDQYIVIALLDELRPSFIEDDVLFEQPGDCARHARGQAEDANSKFGI